MDYAEIRSGQLSRMPVFIHVVQDWEIELVSQILENLSRANIRHGELYKLEWIPLQNQGFQVKSYYRVMRRGGLDFLKEV